MAQEKDEAYWATVKQWVEHCRELAERLDQLPVNNPYFGEARWMNYERDDEGKAHPVPLPRNELLPLPAAVARIPRGGGIGWRCRSDRCGMSRPCFALLVRDAFEEVDGRVTLTPQARRIAEVMQVYGEHHERTNTLILFVPGRPQIREDLLKRHRCRVVFGADDQAWVPVTGIQAEGTAPASTVNRLEDLYAVWESRREAVHAAATPDPESAWGSADQVPVPHPDVDGDEADASREADLPSGHAPAEGTAIARASAEPYVDEPSTEEIRQALAVRQRLWVKLYVEYVRHTGSLNAALMLQHALFLTKSPQPRKVSTSGWIEHHHPDWKTDTALTKQNQETARKYLRAIPAWEENGAHGQAFRFRVRPEHLPKVGSAFIPYHPALGLLFGSHAAVLVGHSLWLTDRSEDGWFTCNWEGVTGMNPLEVQAARRLLRERGVWTEKAVGRKLRYRLCRHMLMERVLSLRPVRERDAVGATPNPQPVESRQEEGKRSLTPSKSSPDPPRSRVGSSPVPASADEEGYEKSKEYGSEEGYKQRPPAAVPLPHCQSSYVSADPSPRRTGSREVQARAAALAQKYRMDLYTFLGGIERYLGQTPSKEQLDFFSEQVDAFSGKIRSHLHTRTGEEIINEFSRLDEEHFLEAVKKALAARREGIPTKGMRTLTIEVERVLKKKTRYLWKKHPDGKHIPLSGSKPLREHLKEKWTEVEVRRWIEHEARFGRIWTETPPPGWKPRRLS
jgi:hypothetical protein